MCILLGNFLCFQTKTLVLVIKGLFDQVFPQHLNAIKIIQMHLGLRPFTMCIALAMAFALKYQCFTIKYKLSPCVQVILDHSKCVSNGYGLLASKNKHLANLPTKIHIFIQGV